MTKAFPFHEDCYTWPRVAVYDEGGATELHVHCLRDARQQFSLVGFIGMDHAESRSVGWPTSPRGSARR